MSERDESFPERPERGPMDQVSAHLDRGWDLLNRGDLAGAQRSAEKSLELDAESPEAHNLLGYVHAARGDADAALEAYREAIALDDSFVEAMLNAAEVLIHPVHDFEGALTMVDDALDWAEGNDEVADALLIKFDAYMHQSDQAQAKRVLASLPEGEFESPRVDFLVGRAHFEVGDVEQAAPHLERAVEREPDNPDAHYWLGLALDATGQHERATLSFLRARELDLSAPRVHWALPAAHFERVARAALEHLSERAKDVLQGALVVVSDLPGPEVVADGVDPRAAALLDALSPKGEPEKAGRLFIYQRNVERMTDSFATVEDDLAELLEAEIAAAFPGLNGEPAGDGASEPGARHEDEPQRDGGEPKAALQTGDGAADQASDANADQPRRKA